MLVLRGGKRGPWLGCNRFPKCRGMKSVSKLDGAEKQQVEALLPLLKDEAAKSQEMIAKIIGANPTAGGPALAGLKNIPTDIDCDECGKPMIIRTGRRGKFLGCSGYPKCRYVKREIDPADIVADRVCPKCGKPLLNRKGRFGSFIGCTGYPDCRYIEGGKRTVTPPAPSELLMDDPCPRCGKPQVLRQGRYGEFKSCSDYPTCKPERAARTTSRPRGTRARKPTAPAA